MSHLPEDPRRLLETLVPQRSDEPAGEAGGIGLLLHLLTCPSCANVAHSLLTAESLSPTGSLATGELAELERLTKEQQRLAHRVKRFQARVARQSGSSVHLVVGGRLDCLLADLLTPAVQNLQSIGESARGTAGGKAS